MSYTVAWDADGLTVYCDECGNPVVEILDETTVELSALNDVTAWHCCNI